MKAHHDASMAYIQNTAISFTAFKTNLERQFNWNNEYRLYYQYKGQEDSPKQRAAVLTLDYSYSMRSSQKIQSVVYNVQKITQDVFKADDSLGVIVFNENAAFKQLPLQKKSVQVEKQLLDFYKTLDSPDGSTNFYGAILKAIEELQHHRQARTMSQSNGETVFEQEEWVIVLSDGDHYLPNASTSFSNEDVLAALEKDRSINLIIIGIGINKNHAAICEGLVNKTPKGKYFSANDNEVSISEAFAQMNSTIFNPIRQFH
jgi:Mg-chelatase subunit ChlD